MSLLPLEIRLCCLRSCFLILAVGFPPSVRRGRCFHAGLFYDQFPLTLDSGRRTEAVGPLFYDQQKDSEKIWAFPPLFSHTTDPTVEYREDDFLYPLLTYESYGREYRWQFCELFSFAGGQEPNVITAKRLTIFPFYFQQRSPDTNENYTALIPFYGHLQHRLLRDKIFFVMFPLYGQSQKKDVVTDNYLYPVFPCAARRRPAWLAILAAGRQRTQGRDHRDQRFRRHDHRRRPRQFFCAVAVLFPPEHTRIGTGRPGQNTVVLPLYCLHSRSPNRDVNRRALAVFQLD